MSQKPHITKFNEIEQRWAIDPRRRLILPIDYSQFHQAEISTGKADDVIRDFKKRVSRFYYDIWIKWEYREVAQELWYIYKWIEKNQRVKLRVRSIIDPRTDKKTGQLTLKEKFRSQNGFKLYKEHDIDISYGLAEELIISVSPEWWVLKNRYNVRWPDERLWDIDFMTRRWDYIQDIRSQLTLWELEVNSIDDIFEVPEWAICQLNGKKEFKCFWTAELQKRPWMSIDSTTRGSYIRILNQWYTEK